MAEAQNTPQVQIKADEKELLGQYSNLVMIHHNRGGVYVPLRLSCSPTARTASWYPA